MWMGSIVIFGIAAALRCKIPDLLLVYLMAMYSLSVAVADQFLALPMIATAVYWRLWPSWAYVTAGVIALCLSQDEFFRSDRPAFADFTIGGHHILMADLGYRCALVGSQVCMLGLLVVVWRNRSAIEERLSAWGSRREPLFYSPPVACLLSSRLPYRGAR